MQPRSLTLPEQILYSPAMSDRSEDKGVHVAALGVYEYHRHGQLIRVELEPGASYPSVANCHQVPCHRTIHFKDGVVHRDHDLPAIEDEDGDCQWYQHGYWHRDGDRPACVRSDGFLQWRKYGLLHRDHDQPASVTDDRQAWWWRGYPHRLAGPATIDCAGQTWLQWKQLHREDGPAIEYTGKIEYYLRDHLFQSEADWRKALPEKRFRRGS